MPRGFLKHKHRAVGRKISRGGNSKSSYEHKGRHSRNTDDIFMDADIYLSSSAFPTYNYNYDFECDYDSDYDDDGLELYHHQQQKQTTRPHDQQQEAQCTVCYDTLPLGILTRNCKNHPACHECLRKIYVEYAQEDVSNYPLRCFHPSCNNKVLQDSHLISHGLFHSDKELKKHQKMTLIAKANKDRDKFDYCPRCELPEKRYQHNRLVKCKQCKCEYFVYGRNKDQSKRHNIQTTIYALEAIEFDSYGENDGWAFCPGCSLVISKGNGCDHMRCSHCRLDFSWSKALEERKRKLTVKKWVENEDNFKSLMT